MGKSLVKSILKQKKAPVNVIRNGKRNIKKEDLTNSQRGKVGQRLLCAVAGERGREVRNCFTGRVSVFRKKLQTLAAKQPFALTTSNYGYQTKSTFRAKIFIRDST